MGWWSNFRDSTVGRVITGAATGGLSEIGRSDTAGRIVGGIATGGLTEVARGIGIEPGRVLSGEAFRSNVGDIAGAQQALAQSQEAQARADRVQMLQYAGASPAELQARQSLLDLQSQVLGRTNRELEFLQRGLDIKSPGAAEAGQGLFSSIIMRQRQAQRAQLESTLRRRFGAGYETTSAGQAALSQFDQGTSDVAVQAIPQFLQTAYGAIGQTATLEDTLARRQMGAIQGTPVAQYAGSEYVGAIQRGLAAEQNRQSQLGLLGTAAGAGLGFMAGGPMGAVAGAQIGRSALGGGGGGGQQAMFLPSQMAGGGGGGTSGGGGFMNWTNTSLNLGQRLSDYFNPGSGGGMPSGGGLARGGSSMFAGGF